MIIEEWFFKKVHSIKIAHRIDLSYLFSFSLFSSPFFLTLLFFGFVFLFFTPTFDTNDDVSMMRMASGRYDGRPNSLLVYIHPFYGFVLSRLYSIFPDIPWYGILFIFFLFLSLYLTTKYIFLIFNKRPIAFVSFFYTLYFYLYATVSIQYTTVASIVVLTGFLILCGEILKRDNFSLRFIGVGIFFIFIGGLIRENAFLYIGALSLPLIVVSYIATSNNNRRRLFIRCLGIIVLLFLFSIFIRTVIYAQAKDWKPYMRWSAAQAFYHAYTINDYKKNETIYKAVGWSSTDYNMLNSWFYTDEDVFSTKKVSSIIHDVRRNNISRDGVSFTIKMIMKQFIYYGMLMTLCAFFLIILFFSAQKKRALALYFFFLIILGVCFILFFSFLGRILPERFFFPFILAISLFALFIYAHNTPHERGLPALPLLFCISIMIFLSGNFILFAQSTKTRAAQFSDIIVQLPKNRFIFNWDSTLPMHWISVFDTLQQFNQKDIAGTGWPQRSPYDRELFKKYHINDLYNDMVDNPYIFLVAAPEYLEFLRSYMQEHYNKQIQIEVEKSFIVRMNETDSYIAQLVQIKSGSL